MKKKILGLFLKHINLKGFIIDLLDDVVEEAVMEAVKKSKTQVDDTFVPMVYPLIEKELIAQINEKLDLEKLLGLDEDENK